MIDSIYQLVKTITNKELRGNVTPDEFNKISKQVQQKIFCEYFGNANTLKNKENRGVINQNLANLTKQMRQKVSLFNGSEDLVFSDPSFDLPEDLYFIHDNGLTFYNNVIEEAESSDIGYLLSTTSTPSETFPIYELLGSDQIKVYPESIQDGVSCRYIREPKDPKWTYVVVNGIEIFDNTMADYQDFELHQSEFSNIVIEILSYFGINLRDLDVTKYAEALKQIKDNKKQQL